MTRLYNTLVNNQRDKEEIKRGIRKYFETNKSNNKEQGQQIDNSNKNIVNIIQQYQSLP